MKNKMKNNRNEMKIKEAMKAENRWRKMKNNNEENRNVGEM
jgi:hypothetical protein